MQVHDAMAQARNTHEVFFLLTAYVEHLAHSDMARSLPVHLTTLPLSSAEDIRRRADVLDMVIAMYFQKPSAESGVVDEARRLFRIAQRRLITLETAETMLSEAA